MVALFWFTALFGLSYGALPSKDAIIHDMDRVSRSVPSIRGKFSRKLLESFSDGDSSSNDHSDSIVYRPTVIS
jgi:hypothetical protein